MLVSENGVMREANQSELDFMEIMKNFKAEESLPKQLEELKNQQLDLAEALVGMYEGGTK